MSSKLLAVGLLGVAWGVIQPALCGEMPAPQPSVDARVLAGKKTYGATCASCHGAELQGAAGPALSGVTFAKSWLGGSRTLRSLIERVSTTMPPTAPGSLTRDQTTEVVAYVLSRSGIAPAVALDTGSLDKPIPAGSGVAFKVAASAHRPLPEGPDHVEPAVGTAPGDADLLEVAAGNWLTYNRDYAGDRFSPLAEISADNAASLRPRCMLQLGELGSFETSPLAYEGELFLTTSHKTFAVDGNTCAVHWVHVYTPVDPEHIPGNRGAALYRGKVYRGTTDGYLLSLDVKTGKLLWSAHVTDSNDGGFISGAPLAHAGKVFVGVGGADHGVKGKFYAFDAENGRPLWTFNLVPEAGEPGRETWGGGEPRGASSWSSVALDVNRRLLFVPTGNPGPDFEGAGRPGNNLYTDAVVALHENTGKLAWYVQQVPHDTHDWDTAAAPALYASKGRQYMAVASKDGLLHLYDRGSHRQVATAQTTTRTNVDVPFTTESPVTYCPGGLGQWNGPAYSAPLNMLFVGAADRCDTIRAVPKPPAFSAGQLDFGAQLLTNPKEPSSGWIRGIDALTAREMWVYHAPTPIVAAVTPTAGNILLTGDLQGHFLVMDARTGRIIYSFMTGGGIAGGITTFESDKRQLIAVPSGNSSRGTWGSTGAATLIVFSLP